MHMLYLDDSGSVRNATDRYLVLGGMSVFERSPHWLSKSLDHLAKKVWPENPEGLEFRGSDILGGKKHWRGIGAADRKDIYREALSCLIAANGVRLFGAVIHKEVIAPDDPMEAAFEHVANRFDRMLGRLFKGGDVQRGLIVLDKSTYETPLQGLALTFRTTGHRWGQLHNLSEVPLFVDSRATRMIQYADLVAHALRRYYERGEPELFNVIKSAFDASGGVVHGLVHYKPHGERCDCPPCWQRE